ncbi:hypothetical protein An08g05930 [Aspergillus niger]|uniref:Uncharacterized protein n=2 Tax=Aspergillus niger TaxID=5061 RepID=A2QRG4_ASPNC|nr:hypothetical protein An08g05930 [Aspergillus niger]CAK45565.1 hypothetical protein An08g05930 [Aspergillus niger]
MSEPEVEGFNVVPQYLICCSMDMSRKLRKLSFNAVTSQKGIMPP